MSWKHFSSCWERITQLECVGIPGQNRAMWIRYKRAYAKECNEWGDFQVHRKALGLISIGRCSNDAEFEELFESYRKEKENFADTLYNSRLLVFGMNSDGTPLTEEQESENNDSSPAPRFRIDRDKGDNPDNDCDNESHDQESSNGHAVSLLDMTDPLRCHDNSFTSKNNGMLGDGKNSEIQPLKDKLDGSPRSQITFLRQTSDKNVDKQKGKTKPVDKKKAEIKNPIKKINSNNSIRDTSGSEVVFYPSVDDCEGLEDSVKEFVTSLFFVLEGTVHCMFYFSSALELINTTMFM